MVTVQMTERERDTILAALRLWQDRGEIYTGGRAEVLLNVAEYTGKALDSDEIDGLHDKLNSLEPKITVTVVGGIVQDVDGIPNGVTVVIKDYDTEGSFEGDDGIKRDSDGELYIEAVYSAEVEK